MFIGTIFLNVIIPILLLVVIGAGLQKKFAFNLRAISNLITYCLMPAAVFINLYETEIDVQVLLEIIGYLISFSLLVIAVTSIISKLLKLDKGESAIFKNSISLINSGNYGIR